VRLAGVESGTYHYSQVIKQDQYDRLLTTRSVEPRIFSPSLWATAVLNHKQGLMTSKKLRQAFQAALDMEPIMAAAVGHPLFYRLDPGLWPPELVLWHSKAGGAAYNQKDKEKARRLLKEAGYTGQPVRWLTTQELGRFYKIALVAKQQLEEVGFRVYFNRVRALPVYTPTRRELRALEKDRADMRRGNSYTLDEFSEWLLGRPDQKARGKKAPARAKA